MNLERLIARGGSKLEITRAIIDWGFETEIPVPRSVYKYYGRPLDPLLKEIASFQRPLIVRGSHPNDWEGFIDVIPTIKDAMTQRDLEAAIRKIETAMKQEEVRIHCEDWGQPYTPEAHILIQEQVPCYYIGSIVRHPNTGSLLLEYTDPGYYGITDGVGGSVTFHRFGENPTQVGGWVSDIDEETLKKLCTMYEAFERSGIVSADWTYQMEFGVTAERSIFFFQARVFKKKEPAKTFKVPTFYGQKIPFIVSSNSEEASFGITPPEGIEFDVFDSHPEDIERVNPSFGDKAYGILSYRKVEAPLPLSARLGKMRLFCGGDNFHNWQSHAAYRLVKRAEYAMLVGVPDRVMVINDELLTEERFRATYISNGRESVLVPSKYLK